MHRTQVYLNADEVALLDRAARSTGATRSELIRRAIRRQYGESDSDARKAALLASAGAWHKRPFTGAQYVNAIRGDLNDRLARLGLE